MLLATALAPAYYRMCSTDVYCSKQTGSSSTKGNHHPSFLRFWNWAGKKTVDAAKFVAAQKMLLKQKPKTEAFVNGLLGFYFALSIYTPLEAHVWPAIIAWVPIDMGSSIYYSLIYFWVPSSCFFA